jgi:anti-anti-sigma regulatory factor
VSAAENLPHHEPHCVIVSMPAQIHGRNAGAIWDCLLAIVDLGPRILILDMSATMSCQHPGAGMIMHLCDRGRLHSIEVRVAAPVPPVVRVFSRAGGGRAASLYRDLASARGAAADPGRHYVAPAGLPGPAAIPARLPPRRLVAARLHERQMGESGVGRRTGRREASYIPPRG